MSEAIVKKGADNTISVVKKMRDYSGESVFKKKAENATAFLEKHGLPKSFAKKK